MKEIVSTGTMIGYEKGRADALNNKEYNNPYNPYDYNYLAYESGYRSIQKAKEIIETPTACNCQRCKECGD